jgi:predicted RNA-binding protein
MDTTSQSTVNNLINAKRSWIVVASRDHVQRAVDGGFAQANHGKSAALKQMRKGNWIIYYSPKEVYGKEAKCQRFTAIGEVTDELLYQGNMENGFYPFRRNVNFLPCAEISILPLIADLTFIKDKVHWGALLKYGVVEIQEQDFQLISSVMLKK